MARIFSRWENILPESFKTDVHYFRLGVLKFVDYDNIEPFSAFTLGATWFHNYDPVEGDYRGPGTSDITMFSITQGGGVKVMFSDKMGLRLQGRLLMPMYFNGLGFFLGGGSGGASAGLGVTSTIPILQGDLTAAPYFSTWKKGVI